MDDLGLLLPTLVSLQTQKKQTTNEHSLHSSLVLTAAYYLTLVWLSHTLIICTLAPRVERSSNLHYVQYQE